MNHWPRPHILRCLGVAWVLRLRLWKSIPGRVLGLAVWGQTEGLRIGVLQTGEWNARAEGTREEVWAHRRSKVPLLGRVRGGGADCHRNLPMQAHMDTERVGHLW